MSISLRQERHISLFIELMIFKKFYFSNTDALPPARSGFRGQGSGFRDLGFVASSPGGRVVG
jgi:hypothetical protein